MPLSVTIRRFAVEHELMCTMKEQKNHTEKPQEATPRRGSRYKLMFLNERKGQVVFAFRMYTWVAAALLAFLIVLTALLVVLIMTRTPLRSFLPGYLDVEKKAVVVEATLRLDSLERESAMRDAYLYNLTAILSGRVQSDSIIPYNSGEVVRFTDSLMEASDRERAFTAAFEEQERYSLTAVTAAGTAPTISFIAPVKGHIFPADTLLTGDDAAQCTYDVHDIRIFPAQPHTILAPADGRVVAVHQQWDGSYSLVLQHLNDYVTELRHLSEVPVRIGQNVRAGSVVGQAGDAASGPQWIGLRIWHRGTSIDPQSIISF